MNLLTFTSLYPNAKMPSRGIFVENRLRHLLESGQVTSCVIAPIPWFPFCGSVSSEYATFTQAPHEESRFGIRIIHPRYLHVPKIGMIFQPFLLALSSYRAIKRLSAQGYQFDVIDAHYFYPDGVAAVILGKMLGKPVTITARGTDINLIPRYLIPRLLIKWAAAHANKLITVCQALKDGLVELGVEQEKIKVLRNGVDLQKFHPPANREDLRAHYAVEGRMILSVGYLIERKGHDLVIQALRELPDVKLLIAGDGPDETKLKNLASELGVENRVRFLGSVSQEKLIDYYGLADILVLASSREGWANVLLESMACGTPVVATRVWGTPEVVCEPAAGRLADRTAKSLAENIQALFAEYPDRNHTRSYAEKFSWDDTTQGQLDIFGNILSDRQN